MESFLEDCIGLNQMQDIVESAGKSLSSTIAIIEIDSTNSNCRAVKRTPSEEGGVRFCHFNEED